MPPKEEGMCGEEIPLYLFCVIVCFRHKYVFVLNLKGIAKLIRFWCSLSAQMVKKLFPSCVKLRCDAMFAYAHAKEALPPRGWRRAKEYCVEVF